MTDAVVVNYDSEGYLAACLDALEAQKGLRSTVVIDNGPRPEAVRRIVGGRPNALFVSNRRNVGFARACNQGFRLTTGGWVLLVNPDCRLAPGALAEMLRCAEAHPRGAMVGPKLCNDDGTLQTSAYALPTLAQSVGHLLGLKTLVPVKLLRCIAGGRLGRVFGQLAPHDTETQVEMVTGACALLRRTALREVGLFDPGFFLYNEEKDWCERARRCGWEVWFTPAAQAVHSIGGSGPAGSATAFQHRCLGMLRFYAKHRSPRSLKILRAAVATAALCRSLVSSPPDVGVHRHTARYAWSYAP